MFSSEVDFPKLFSHVIDIEISKFGVLRAVFSHVVDIEISNFVSLCARARGHGDTGICLAPPKERWQTIDPSSQGTQSLND